MRNSVLNGEIQTSTISTGLATTDDFLDWVHTFTFVPSGLLQFFVSELLISGSSLKLAQ